MSEQQSASGDGFKPELDQRVKVDLSVTGRVTYYGCTYGDKAGVTDYAQVNVEGGLAKGDYWLPVSCLSPADPDGWPVQAGDVWIADAGRVYVVLSGWNRKLRVQAPDNYNLMYSDECGERSDLEHGFRKLNPKLVLRDGKPWKNWT